MKNTSSDIANFKSKILEILPDRKISIAGLATIINKQMVAAGIEKNPTTEFLKQFNLPKGLKKAIITHMSDEVIVTEFGFIMHRIYASLHGAKIILAKEKDYKASVNEILKKV